MGYCWNRFQTPFAHVSAYYLAITVPTGTVWWATADLPSSRHHRRYTLPEDVDGSAVARNPSVRVTHSIAQLISQLPTRKRQISSWVYLTRPLTLWTSRSRAPLASRTPHALECNTHQSKRAWPALGSIPSLDHSVHASIF